MSTCTTCDGLITEPYMCYDAAERLCHCQHTVMVNAIGGVVRVLPTLETPQGWQCPICKTVHAPHIQSCPARHGAGE